MHLWDVFSSIAKMVIREPKQQQIIKNDGLIFFNERIVAETKKKHTKITAIKQHKGLRAQINETCRHDNIEPKPNTTNTPKTAVI